MKQWTRDERLAALTKERGLSKRGFRRSLRKLVAEFVPDPDERELEFAEWFGRPSVVPAAYRIVRESNGDGIWDVTIEVYEVEGSAEIPFWKLAYYGDVADREGPNLDLHILDRYDHEIVVRNNDLMCFWFIDVAAEIPEGREHNEALLKWMRSRAVVQHHAPVVIDDKGIAERDREIRILKRQLMKADHTQVAGALQEIIYGLGLKRSHKDIAQYAKVQPAVVRATARLLAADKIDPTTIVKNTHARWKAAYDAVRELGVQL